MTNIPDNETASVKGIKSATVCQLRRLPTIRLSHKKCLTTHANCACERGTSTDILDSHRQPEIIGRLEEYKDLKGKRFGLVAGNLLLPVEAEATLPVKFVNQRAQTQNAKIRAPMLPCNGQASLLHCISGGERFHDPNCR